MLACFFAALVAASAHAQAPLTVPLAMTSTAAYPAPLQALLGLKADATVEQVAALPADRFEAFSPKKLYLLGVDSPLWLKLNMSTEQAATRVDWLLEFPSIIVDRYEFYQRDSGGQWRMSAAGDRVAHSQWPMDGLRARFPLRMDGAGEQAVFIRVVHQHQTNFQPLIVQASEAIARDSLQMLWVGLLLGVVFTLVLTCAQMSLAYRDATYGWYAGYLIFTMLAALCYSGIAQRSFWPDATKFASDAIVYSVMAALAFNLEFSRAMFGGLQSGRARFVSRALVALCIGYMIATVFSERYDRLIVVFEVLSLAVFSFIITAAVQAWRGGVVFGGYWLMVYVPYLMCISLTLANSAGFVNASWLPGATPVLAAIAEAVAMMLCINAYGRQRHARAVREQEATRYDPLTGFLKESVFTAQAARTWNALAGTGRDMTVVYVTVEPVGMQPLSTVESEALMASSVRQVRTIAREFDAVGRLGRNRIGIVMVGTFAREALASRMARLVALGLMQGDGDVSAVALRFGVCVGNRASFAGDFKQLDLALHQLGGRDDRRAIRFLDAELTVRRLDGATANMPLQKAGMK